LLDGEDYDAGDTETDQGESIGMMKVVRSDGVHDSHEKLESAVLWLLLLVVGHLLLSLT